MDQNEVDMDAEDDEDAGDDKLEEVRPGPATSRSHPCRFCSESFSSELRLILHFREEHLDPEDLSEDDSDISDPEEDESKEEDSDVDVDTSMPDFVTDYERVLLLKESPLFNPDPDGRSEEEAVEADDPEPDEGEDEHEVEDAEDNDSAAESSIDHDEIELIELIESDISLPCETGEGQEPDESPPVPDDDKGQAMLGQFSLPSSMDRSTKPLKRPRLQRKCHQLSSTTATCDKRQQTRRLLPLLRSPKKVAAPKKDMNRKASEGRSPEVVIRQVPSKSSNVSSQVDDPGKSCAPEKPPRTAKTAVKGSFECVFCHTSYSKQYLLHDHIRSHIKESPHFCKFCDKSFSVSRYLDRHIRKAHSRLAPFKCKFCSESFPTQSKLKNHMTSHSAERKFECEYCEMRCYNKKDLTRHMNSHIGERPFECDLCKKGFSRRDNLYYHMKNIHNVIVLPADKERNFECEYCKNRFVRKGDMTRHVRTFHSS